MLADRRTGVTAFVEKDVNALARDDTAARPDACGITEVVATKAISKFCSFELESLQDMLDPFS